MAATSAPPSSAAPAPSTNSACTRPKSAALASSGSPSTSGSAPAAATSTPAARSGELMIRTPADSTNPRAMDSCQATMDAAARGSDGSLAAISYSGRIWSACAAV
eukprot:7383609-Prymnesium_polylepis.2